MKEHNEMKDYGLDTHKLMYHVDRVSRWLNGEEISPIFIEICPIGKCNHMCVFCAYNYTDYNGPMLEYANTMKVISELGELGVKSFDWDTEGEPLLHPNIPDFINHAKKCGIDSGVETNGVLLTEKFMEKCGHSITYIKVSVDAACNETHYKLHRGGKKDFDKIIKNVEIAVKIKTGCTIGVQLILFKENEDEVKDLAKICRDIGVDYMVVKPFEFHPFQDNTLVHMGDVGKVLDIPGIIVKKDTFNRVLEERDYPTCYGVNFMSNIDCYGNVTMCTTFTGKREYNLGNIYKESFPEIWKRHPKAVDVQKCNRKVCRMDKQNAYLWRLKNPQGHDNFI